jgi:hypothetical protein
LIIVDDQKVIFACVEDDSWQAINNMSKSFVKIFTEFFYHDIKLNYQGVKRDNISMCLSESEQTFLIFFNMSTFFIRIAMYLIKGPGYSGGYRTLKHNLNREKYT